MIPEFDPSHFRVAIFGSARIKPGTEIYKQVKELAKLIGKQGIDVVTGGGPGLMHAANEGHKSDNNGRARSIGLNIRLPMEQDTNPHLDIKEEFDKFSGRLDTFMNLSNAVVVAPGGVGTLLEFFYTWQLVQVKHICHIPIILLGDMWPPLIKWIEKYPLNNKLLSNPDLNSIFLAKDCNEAMKVIDTAYKAYKRGGKNFCLNHKKYKIS